MNAILQTADLEYYVFDNEEILVASMDYPIIWVLQDTIRTKETFQERMQRLIHFLLEEETE